MNYNEEQQKIILHEMESDLMSLVAVDAETDDFEVIFSDGAYRDFNDRFQGKDFFGKWQSTGISMVWEADRERMRTELSKSFLLKEFEDKDVFVTACRFINGNSPVNCRVKVAKEDIRGLLISTSRGQLANTALFDCDYYEWLDGHEDKEETFEGEFMAEYSWGEYLMKDLFDKLYES